MSPDEKKISREIRKDFWKLLERVGEDQEDVHKVIEFLNTVMRTSKNPPTLEIISVLKHERPILIQRLRAGFPEHTHIHQLTRMDIPYEIAKERLDI